MTKHLKIVDQLGELKARIAELTAEEKVLKDRLAARGAGAYEGEEYRATISITEREGRDPAFRQLVEELVAKHTTPQYRAAHTTISEVVSVRVVARVRDAA